MNTIYLVPLSFKKKKDYYEKQKQCMLRYSVFLMGK